MEGFFRLGGALVTIACSLPVPAPALEIDGSVRPEQAQLIQGDLGYLKQIQYQDNETDRATTRLLKIRGRVTAEQLRSWLEARVLVVVSEDLKLEESVLVSKARPIYPEANVFPPVEKPPTRKPDSKPEGPSGASGDSKPKVVMSNLGAGLYLMAKQRQILLAMRKSDGKIIPVTSPRVGLVQIGEGLFFKKFQVNPEVPGAPANSVSRLSTIFHEARHSDGHGESLSFGHAYCPSGHAYEGYPACDRNLNGPYTIGAQMLKTLTQGCGDCSIKEKTILKAIEADSRSRVLKAYRDSKGNLKAATLWSDRPERILKVVQHE